MNFRRRRSSNVIFALKHFFESLCMKRQLDAVTLTTQHGEFIAGAGENDTDIEHLGLVGATSHRRSLDFDERPAFVSRFEVNDAALCLTSLGAPLGDDDAIGGVMRILGQPV
jgi:hypothetical protein